MNVLIIFVKLPTPGQVKTRLGKIIGNQEAAELYRLFIQETFAMARQLADCKIHVAFEPTQPGESFDDIIPGEFLHFPQQGKDLGERMCNAFRHGLTQAQKVVIIGSDSPTLPGDYIEQAFERLTHSDLVLGPAEDGGYYLIGMKELHVKLFDNIAWSSDAVFRTTLQRAKRLQLKVALLPAWYDVDDLDALLRAAEDDQNGKIRTYLDEHRIILNHNP